MNFRSTLKQFRNAVNFDLTVASSLLMQTEYIASVYRLHVRLYFIQLGAAEQAISTVVVISSSNSTGGSELILQRDTMLVW